MTLSENINSYDDQQHEHHRILLEENQELPVSDGSQQQQQQQQLEMIREMKESLLREIKELNTSCHTNKMAGYRMKRKARVLRKGRNSIAVSANTGRQLNTNVSQPGFYDGLNNDSYHSSARKNAVKSTGKKVLNVASLPFRKVKKKFTIQTTSGTDKRRIEVIAENDYGAETVNHRRISSHSSEPIRLDRGSTKQGMSAFVSRAMSPVASLLSRRSYSETAAPDDPSRTTPNTENGVPVTPSGSAMNQLQSIDTNIHVTDDVVKQAENLLRIICGFLLAYYLGVQYPAYQAIATKAGEYATVAWATCVSIRVLTAIRQYQQLRKQEEQQHRSQHYKHYQYDQLHREEDRSGELYSDDEDLDDCLDAHVARETTDGLQGDDFHHDVKVDRDEDVWLPSTDEDHPPKIFPSFLNDDDTPALQQASPKATAIDTNRDFVPLNERIIQKDQAIELKNDQAVELENESDRANENQALQQTQTVVHPSLQPFYMIDTMSNARIFANTSTTYPIETDYFKGEMLMLIRTPNVDDIEKEDPTRVSFDKKDENASAVNYFRGKLRRFELQIQVKLKKVPTGRVYFACELGEAVKLGMIQRAFVGAALSFIKTKNKFFHYSLSGTSPDIGSGDRYESPHIAFPIEDSMDRLVRTPPGQTPPRLGEEIFEDPEAIKHRKKTMQIDYNTTDTYTFSLWSAYIDFLGWCCLNLPGIRPFSVSSVIGSQPINLTLYEILETDSETGKPLDKHYKSEMISIVKFELCNSAHSTIGPATRKWKATHRKEVEKQNQDKLKREDSETSIKVDDNYEEEEMQADFLVMDEVGDYFESSLPVNDLHDEYSSRNRMDDKSEHAAEELGEGIYLQSGDTISLRESSTLGNATGNNSKNDMTSLVDEVDHASFNRATSFDQSVSSCLSQGKSDSLHCYVTHAGGFAVLQETITPPAIIIEKAGKSAKSKSKLIKSGDTVVCKMAGRYLSLHRGWWLKWVAASPSKNSYFIIHKNDREFTNRNEGLRESQSSYLTLGNSFCLKHRRWSKYSVGVSAEESAVYGGRMLGLRRGSNLGDFPNDIDEGDLDPDSTLDDKGSAKKSQWMRPLLLSAYELPSIGLSTTPGFVSDKKITESNSLDEKCNRDAKSKILFAHEHYQVDVPAWLEILNRTERIRQHTYAVRVIPPLDSDALERNASPQMSEEKNATMEDASFIRLRTGRDLAQVMQTGMKWRNSVASPRKGKINDSIPPRSPRSRTSVPTDGSEGAGRFRRRSISAPNLVDLADVGSVSSFDGIENFVKNDELGYSQEFLSLIETADKQDEASESESEIESSDGSEWAESMTECRQDVRKRRKGRKLLGKVARAMKTKAASTGRTVVRTTTNTGKYVVLGTAYVGKSILPIRSKPMKKPKPVGTRHYIKQRGKDLSLDVRARSLRRIELLEAESTGVFAGISSAPEESRRTVSTMASKMSSETAASSMDKGFSFLLSALLASASDHDNNFLKGGALQLGVAPSKKDSSNKGSLVVDSVVARCLWESHWREEWCALYESGLSFYAPLTNTPCLEISLVDITSVRLLDFGEMCPLPGYPLLALETAWICHYCAFANEDARETFYRKIEDARTHMAASSDQIEMSGEQGLKEAHFWQGFSNSIDFSRAHGKGKWESIQSGAKMKSRVVLNNRRMVFDLPRIVVDINRFVEEMLATVLSFSLSSLQKNPEALISFLDSVSQLRSLPLNSIDRSSQEAYCLFVNIYHCLLQHSMLFSVNGPLQKRSCLHFMRTNCYEIGGEIFSLAEIYSCVIRGNMSRSIAPRPPYFDVSKKSNAYRFYALSYFSPRTNFMLNTADVSSPRTVPVLNPIEMDDQLNAQVRIFLRKNVFVDATKKLVLLPKVFEVYRNDFVSEEQGFALACLQFSIPFLSDETISLIRALRHEDLFIRFQPATEQYHSSLQPLP